MDNVKHESVESKSLNENESLVNDRKERMAFRGNNINKMEADAKQQIIDTMNEELALETRRNLPRKYHSDGALQRQPNFKADSKINPIMKGASALRLSQFHKYDTDVVVDPLAAPSGKVKGDNGDNGDGDVWVEEIMIHKGTGKKQAFFVSKKTGERVKDEPPSGASKVIFLKNSQY